MQACGPACFWMKRFAHPSIEQKMIVICAQERTGWIQRLLKELFPLHINERREKTKYLGYNPTRSMWCNHTLVRTQEASSTYIQTIISHHFAKGPANFPWILFQVSLLFHIQILTLDILFDQFKEFYKKLFAVSAK